MKKIIVICVCLIMIATVFGASVSVLGGKGGQGKKPPKDDPTPADPAIAYYGGGRKDHGLWVMDADGSHQTHVPIADGVYPFHISWAPDGMHIAITSMPYNTVYQYLWIIDISVDENGEVQGSNARKVIQGNIRPGDAVWSPNGDKIAYVKAETFIQDPPYSIWLYNVGDGTTENIYTDPDDYLKYLTWDPTGTKLAFVKDPMRIDSVKDPPSFQILDVGTGDVETVYTFPDNGGLPSYYNGGLDWANYDDKLVFRKEGRFDYKIAYYDISDNEFTTLDASYYAVTPSWSPDDSLILYKFNEPGRKRKVYINTIDVITEEITTLAEVSGPDVCGPDWCIALE